MMSCEQLLHSIATPTRLTVQQVAVLQNDALTSKCYLSSNEGPIRMQATMRFEPFVFPFAI